MQHHQSLGKCKLTPQQDTTIHPLECLEKFCFVLFCFGCIGSSLLRAGFLYLCRAGALLRCGVWASHCGGFSCVERMGSRRAGFSSCDLRALEHRQAQQLWHTGLVALQLKKFFKYAGKNIEQLELSYIASKDAKGNGYLGKQFSCFLQH